MVITRNQHPLRVDCATLLNGGGKVANRKNKVNSKLADNQESDARCKPSRRDTPASVSFAPLPPPDLNRATSFNSFLQGKKKKSVAHLKSKESGATSKSSRRATTATVSFAPLPRPDLMRAISLNSFLHEKKKKSVAHLRSKGFRQDYSIGDTVRSLSHMVTKSTPLESFRTANALQKHDFAFIKRTDGSFSYAILAFRSLELPHHKRKSYDVSLEEYMAFVMSGTGTIKMLNRKRWSKDIWLPSMVGLDHLSTRTCTKIKHEKTRKKDAKGEWSPPSIISFIPTVSSEDDDLSQLDANFW
eukprot:CAMPEP_0172315980 /NCGR_PEP_ID=MMETSP1058-20130122/26839_1 /TAXON_ID=83371 /ORGANISM="Detonula confervacea, Strain CCMP 353" /LENGTH=300 /DNA_ID=CAMNT_0013030191 /DNA_START=47 /DNA_END=949 /DNA_ORIENTATION=-